MSSDQITLSLTKQKLFYISISAGILFFILSSPIVYSEVSRIIQQVTGKTYAKAELASALNWQIILIHALVYAVLVYFSLKYYNRLVKF